MGHGVLIVVTHHPERSEGSLAQQITQNPLRFEIINFTNLALFHYTQFFIYKRILVIPMRSFSPSGFRMSNPIGLLT
jgi:hypothetical protein